MTRARASVLAIATALATLQPQADARQADARHPPAARVRDSQVLVRRDPERQQQERQQQQQQQREGNIPFGVGERFTYEVKVGPFKAGRGSMEVLGIDTVRGRDTWHTVFRVKGGMLGYKADMTMESWIDTATMASLRFNQDIEQTGSDRKRNYEIFPERQAYQEGTKPEQPSVADPLDDGSFIYFIRTVPLEIGRTYSYERYFRPDRNPVRIRVLRRETVKVPAGTFQTIVVQPMIKSKGIFSENSKAEIWFSEDANRIMVQMKADLPFGSLNLYLTSARPPTLSIPSQ